jgi:SAM-dependent methyltransferase
MSDDISDIAAYYNRNPQAEHRRLEENQLEYDLTWRFLDAYLPPAGEILEIGAGTGRYTLGLIQRGYTVTAVDLSEAILKECQKNLAETGLQEKAKLIIGDARYLRHVPKKEFDAVLMMGPLYHLVEESDRQLALQEAYKRIRPGGVIFSAFISRLGILGEILKFMPESIEDKEQVGAVLTRGRDREDWPKGGFRAYFARVEEVIPLHEGVGFETIKLVGVEPCISSDDESYNVLKGERRSLWLDLFYEISGEPSIVGASQHMLYIGRKKPVNP